MSGERKSQPAAVVRSAEGRSSGADVAGASDAMKALALKAQQRHNHLTRDIKPPGVCPKCDERLDCEATR